MKFPKENSKTQNERSKAQDNLAKRDPTLCRMGSLVPWNSDFSFWNFLSQLLQLFHTCFTIYFLLQGTFLVHVHKHWCSNKDR